jgi:starvation-inducible DNA-binding protein
MDSQSASARNALATSSEEFSSNAMTGLPEALNALLADIFAVYLKTKSFHWHMSGPHFRDYHLLLDEQATQIFATTDVLAERVRKLGSTTLRSIGHIARLQRVRDHDGAERLAPADMLAELCRDNKAIVREMREVHALCDRHSDVATASILEVYIDEGERRIWFLGETIAPEPALAETALAP